MKQGPFAQGGCVVLPVAATTTPSDFLSARPSLPAPHGYRQPRFPGTPGAEEDLSSSLVNLLTIPRPLRRGVHQRPLQDPERLPWHSPCNCRLCSPLAPTRRRGVHLTTPQASLHVADWPVARPLTGTLSLRFDTAISAGAGSRATGDPGISPDRTLTGWLTTACRSVTP